MFPETGGGVPLGQQMRLGPCPYLGPTKFLLLIVQRNGILWKKDCCTKDVINLVKLRPQSRSTSMVLYFDDNLGKLANTVLIHEQSRQKFYRSHRNANSCNMLQYNM